MKSPLSASAKGRHSQDDQGVPWQNTTAGPEPARSQAIRRPCQSKFSMPPKLGQRGVSTQNSLPSGSVSTRHGTRTPSRSAGAAPATRTSDTAAA